MRHFAFDPAVLVAVKGEQCGRNVRQRTTQKKRSHDFALQGDFATLVL